MPPQKITSTSFIFSFFYYSDAWLIDGDKSDSPWPDAQLRKMMRGPPGVFCGGLRGGFFGFVFCGGFFLKQELRQLTKIFGQHTFSNSTFVFYIMLVFQDNSEHWELLQVSQVTSESTFGISPTGHSLGGLPSISGAPNRKLQNCTETSIPTQSPSSGDLCLSSSEGRNPNILNT